MFFKTTDPNTLKKSLTTIKVETPITNNLRLLANMHQLNTDEYFFFVQYTDEYFFFVQR